MRFLLIQNGSISEAICSTPAIEALRKAYPNAKIDILVNDYNECVIKNNPFIDTIYSFKKAFKDPFSQIAGFSSRMEMKSRIWQRMHDACIIFSNKNYKKDLSFAKFSGAKMIIGVEDTINDVINIPIKYHRNHQVLFDCELLAPLDVKYNGEKTLFIPDKIDTIYKDYVFVHINAELPNNNLGHKKLEQIIGFLSAKNKVVITASDSRSGKNMSKDTGVPYLQTKNIMELAGHLQYAKFVVTPYGGVAHLAPALSVRTLVIFGETDPNQFSPNYAKGKCIALRDKTKIARNVSNRLIFEAIVKEFAY